MKVSIDADPLTLLKISSAKDKSHMTWTEVVCKGLGVEYNQATFGRPSAGEIEERYKVFLADFQEQHEESIRQDLIKKTKNMEKRIAEG